MIKRLPQLDGIRGLAILFVLVWHYLVCQTSPEAGTLGSYFLRSLSLTWSGVDLFFVLSGFLICGILLDNRDAKNYFQVFYLRRACRIFPLYFALLGAFILLTSSQVFSGLQFKGLFSDPFPIWSYMTFTQNIFMGFRGNFGPDFLGITWSLAVEEQFYLFVPLMIYFLPRRVLLVTFVCAVLAAPIMRSASGGFQAFVNPPWRSDSLLAGGSLAILIRWEVFSDVVRRYRQSLLPLLSVLLVGLGAMSFWPKQFGVINHLWLAAFYSAFILFALFHSDHFSVKWLKSPVLIYLGRLSYGIYIFHQIANGLLHGLINGGSPKILTAADGLVTLLALFLTVAAADISYRLIENPMIALGHSKKYISREG
ncbi:MAG: acyltransferase [Prosthecobacter sp.]